MMRSPRRSTGASGGSWIPGRLLAALLALAGVPAECHELLVSLGTGAQPGSDQSNRLQSIEYSFYTRERSARQHLQVGVAYTRISTNAASNRDLYAVSVYPQLTLYPREGSRIARRAPVWAKPYFFARALGPSYISENTLGDRKQDNNLAFLAQVGAGFLVDIGENARANFSVSWKHFSNANLFDDNDGIDVPLVISWGVRF